MRSRVGYMKLCVEKLVEYGRMYLHIGVLSRWSVLCYDHLPQRALEFLPNFGPSTLKMFHSTQFSPGSSVWRKISYKCKCKITLYLHKLFHCTLPFFRLLDSTKLSYIGSASVYIFKLNPLILWNFYSYSVLQFT
jgi:hypothetical protein